MIREAIAEYIKARTANLKGCEHQWQLLVEHKCSSRLNPDYQWSEFNYYCPKCLSHRVIKTDNQ